jgi:hypothetical protein
MASARPSFSQIKGNGLGFGALGELAARVGITPKRITSPAIGATIAFTAASSSARTVTVTLTDRKGNAINYNAQCDIMLMADALGANFATTGGSTGAAQGATGKLLAIVAKKIFRGITGTAGTIVFTYTDSAAEVVYLGVRLPNGEVVMGAVMTTS